MYYSQHGEDKYIDSFFNGKNYGVCIEVGAYDGVTLSNTYFFEKKGWLSLCIEPIQSSYQKCKEVRKQTVNCCISSKDSEDKEFSIYHIGDNLCAISSLEPDTRLIESQRHLVTNTTSEMVKVRSLTSLMNELELPKVIDFVSIDTGNTELDVLKGIDFEKYHIKMFVIENNYDEPFCADYLKQFGYIKLHRLAVNDFYLKTSSPFEPIRYLSTGKLGDFIHQLSVINENYIKTGKQGILYVTNKEGMEFSYGLERTFNDTKNIIMSLPYIHSYKIYENEQFDIDLGSWRSSDILYTTHWYNIFKKTYNVEWGKHPWLFVDKDPIFENKILISLSARDYRFPQEIDFEKLFHNVDKDKLLFITQTISEYTFFKNKTGIELNVYICHSFDKLIQAIGSCRQFVGNLSSPLAIAFAFHKSCYGLISSTCYDSIHNIGIESALPFVEVASKLIV